MVLILLLATPKVTVCSIVNVLLSEQVCSVIIKILRDFVVKKAPYAVLRGRYLYV